MAEEKKTTKTTSSTSKKVATKKTTAKKVVKEEVANKEEKVVETAEVKTEAKKANKPAPKKEVKKEAKKEVKEEKLIPLPTEAKAVALNVRVTPRKARLVIDLVRGKSVKEAKAILTNLRKAAATPVLKVVKSAEANAINNFNLDEDKLYIKEIYASDGLKMKRYMPRAKGSASGLVKRTSHITCVVKEK